MCLYPKLIKNKKYTVNKKNGGQVPPVSDSRVLLVPVGCGKCVECRKQKSRNWQVRLKEEIKINKNGIFVTLTFKDEELKKLKRECKSLMKLSTIEENEIATLAVRRFLERWRKKYKKSIRHWLVTELGHQGTERIHLHGIIFTDKAEEIEKIWQYGMVWIGKFVNEMTINYIVKYITKVDIEHKGFEGKVLCSKGIGSNYINKENKDYNKYRGEKTREHYMNKNGSKIALPTYYRNKIYTDEEREQLWLNMLDKKQRYVCGEVIDISENEDNYYNILEHYRKINKKLGYGDDTKNWSVEEYIRKRKKLI